MYGRMEVRVRVICSVFTNQRRDGMYLYVDKRAGLARVPEELLQRFGTPRHVLDMLLTPQRRLARVSADAVLDALDTQGFYLQLPPPRPKNLLEEHLELQRGNGPHE